ncbi:MAG TPA: hypothetical protein RMH85_30100 [Polyangiaceae bacterium LLY-WYZ-15_(1-7)]|nr:hypothetical protein [Polyangiaceae bacterium LLY-WYZ-15_(1-7)]HJL03513.1 hypothetical protein [Polyangiaceae bacterium LLY-WYZ-15_(1-7)]HJL12773.1 hypothetical protein [Polyangiaceae bacterium LLY-WYZ-15_(1-7)]HJL32933.1 hypothetical protein [Polyangiaceae bacterium LLY-WYZ-15_(1-7)]HJL49401.1 hypothetical protein [Polyangiaceae bacterium LLY-WYZ-15_(1-7)]
MRLTAPALLLALALGPAAACTDEPTEEVLLPSTLGPDRGTPADGGGFGDDPCAPPEGYPEGLEPPPCDGDFVVDGSVPGDPPDDGILVDGSVPGDPPHDPDGDLADAGLVEDPYQ